MLYKVGPMGYFSRVHQVSQGAWFDQGHAEDDNLEIYFRVQDENGKHYLLSNNMSYGDREDFVRLYKAHKRADWMSYGASLALAGELAIKHPYFRKMAIGWRCTSFLLMGTFFNSLMGAYIGNTYAPLMGAYLRKYSEHMTKDKFEMIDRKREFYEIDTSQYMSYTNEGLHSHFSHGPQPDGEACDATWLTEMDAFLNNKPNHLKEHPRFLNYAFQFKDKSFPSAEMAGDLIKKH